MFSVNCGKCTIDLTGSKKIVGKISTYRCNTAVISEKVADDKVMSRNFLNT